MGRDQSQRAVRLLQMLESIPTIDCLTKVIGDAAIGEFGDSDAARLAGRCYTLDRPFLLTAATAMPQLRKSHERTVILIVKCLCAHDGKAKSQVGKSH